MYMYMYIHVCSKKITFYMYMHVPYSELSEDGMDAGLTGNISYDVELVWEWGNGGMRVRVYEEHGMGVWSLP